MREAGSRSEKAQRMRKKMHKCERVAQLSDGTTFTSLSVNGWESLVSSNLIILEERKYRGPVAVYRIFDPENAKINPKNYRASRCRCSWCVPKSEEPRIKKNQNLLSDF